MMFGCLQAYLKGGKLIRLLDKSHPGLLEVKVRLLSRIESVDERDGFESIFGYVFRIGVKLTHVR